MTDKMNSEIKDGRKEKPADNDNNIAGIASTAGVESEPDRETEEDEEYEKRRIRNRARIEQMKQEKQRRLRMQKMVMRIAPLAVVGILLLVGGIVMVSNLRRKNPQKESPQALQTQETQAEMQVQETQAEMQVQETQAEMQTQETQAEMQTQETQAAEDSNQTGPQALQTPVPANVGRMQKNALAVMIPPLYMVQATMSQKTPKANPLKAMETDNTQGFPDTVVSSNGLLIDVENQEIVAMKNPYQRISPASMTKILTILVAAEHMENPDDTFTITSDVIDYCFAHDCSNVGFETGEVVTVRDLFYGTILPSGADAALGLAVYTAGSGEAFVEMMNEKLDELGISETTHFTNCVGLYDEEHYSTTYDMAVILKAAYDNPFCREVLSAHIYTTTPTSVHPEGMILSNWFLRRIEDKDTHGEVLAAKTGYVAQSGSCAASMAEDVTGKKYICVTANSSSSWRCIYDQVELYAKYLTGE